jgi:hypothetical protein
MLGVVYIVPFDSYLVLLTHCIAADIFSNKITGTIPDEFAQIQVIFPFDIHICICIYRQHEIVPSIPPFISSFNPFMST